MPNRTSSSSVQLMLLSRKQRYNEQKILLVMFCCSVGSGAERADLPSDPMICYYPVKYIDLF